MVESAEKASRWRIVAIGFLVINIAGFGMAIRMEEFWHAMAHVGLGVACWVWMQNLKRPLAAGHANSQLEERVQVLELDVTRVREELMEAQERLDFAERMLAQLPDQKRVAPDRP